MGIADVQGKITYANENFCKISKYSREELVGSDHRIVNSGFHPKEFFADLWRTISSGKIWEGEILNKAKDGTPYWVESNIVPLFNEDGGIKEYLAIRKDISVRKKLELDLRELNQSLEAKVEERTRQMIDAEAKLVSASKMSSLGMMAGGVAHEINNPLGIIKLMTSQIQDLHGEEPFNKALAEEMTTKVIKTTERIAKIVHGLRTFSRDGSADSIEEVNARSFVEDTLSLCMERMRNHGVRL